MSTEQQHPIKQLEDGETYTMADLRRIDPSGGLAQRAQKQLADLSGLVTRTRDAQRASAAPVSDEDTDVEEDVPAAPQRRPGLGLLGDRLAPDDTVRWR